MFWTVRSGSLCGGKNSRRWLKSQNWEYAVPITKRRTIWGSISQLEPKSDVVCPFRSLESPPTKRRTIWGSISPFGPKSDVVCHLGQIRSLESPKPNDARFGAQFRNLSRNRTPFAPLNNFGPWSPQNQTTHDLGLNFAIWTEIGRRLPPWANSVPGVPKTKRRTVWGSISQFEPKSDAVCPLKQFRSLEPPKPNDARFGAQFRHLDRNRTSFAPFGPWSLQNQTTHDLGLNFAIRTEIGRRLPLSVPGVPPNQTTHDLGLNFAIWTKIGRRLPPWANSVAGVFKTKRRTVWGSILQVEPKSDAVCPFCRIG